MHIKERYNVYPLGRICFYKNITSVKRKYLSLPTAISARVPIQIDLLLQPGDPRNRSVYCVLRFPLTHETIQTIKSLAVTKHISIEGAFVAYLKQVIPRQKNMQRIISQLHQNVTLDVQLNPVLISLGLATSEEIEQLRQQALLETYDDYFTCVAHVISTWGFSPSKV